MRHPVIAALAIAIQLVATHSFAQYPQSSPQYQFLDSSHHQAVVTAEFGTLGLVREAPDSQTIAIDDSFQPLYNADSLQGSMQFGFTTELDIHNVRPWFGGTDLQFGYFGINSLDAETTVAADGVTSTTVSSVFFNSIPVNPLSTTNISYSSNLYSAEANVVMASNYQVRPIVGFRYFKLEDSYDAFDFTGGQRFGGFSLTNNSMYGGQLGLEGEMFRRSSWSLYASGKVGAMHNDVEGSAIALDSAGTTTVKNYSDSSYATLVDGGVGLCYHVVGPLTLKVGYRSLFASKVATGIDQNGSVRLLSPGETVVFNSQQWHGIDLGAVFEF